MKEYTKYYTPSDEGIEAAKQDMLEAREKEKTLVEFNQFAAFCRDSIKDSHSLDYSSFYDMVQDFLEVYSNFKEEE